MKQGQFNKPKPAFETTQDQIDEQTKQPGALLKNIWNKAGSFDQAAARKKQSKEIAATILLASWVDLFKSQDSDRLESTRDPEPC